MSATLDDSDDEQQVERTLKLVVLGDGAAGKTSVCARLAQGNFARQYRQTVGLDFFSKRIQLPGSVHVLLQVWDIGGQSLAGPMLDKYVYGAHGAMVVYDVTNLDSFVNLEDWVNIVKKFTSEQEKPPHMALVGNKTDLEQKRAVRIERHVKFAEQHNMSSHYVSAKTGDSVTLLFKQVAAEILGIKLTRNDLEQEVAVVSAEIEAAPPPPAASSNARNNRSKSSSVCALQ